MKSGLKTLLIYGTIVVIAIILISSILSGMTGNNDLKYDEIVGMIYNGEVKEFTITSSNKLIITTQDGVKYSRVLRSVDLFFKDIDEYLDIRLQTPEGERALVSYDIEDPQIDWLGSLILPGIMLVGFVVLTFVLMGRMNGGARMLDFGKAKTRALPVKNSVTFADVAGEDEEKEELKEVVDYLKNPAKYTRLGAKIPHGVLMIGPPGTGKTLLAKAVAGEAGVPFLSISGSDFMEMYVGVGASRVRDLFETARRTPACIIFIDEIDAIGRRRGTGVGGGHDEREQTLNQLLVEMDGFGRNDGTIVMAATNRPDILDPALTRPGRFDRQITVGYPDIQGRLDILKVHAVGKPFENSVDFQRIASMTVNFTGADLANLLNEAALLAARRGKSLIGPDDIDDAMIKVFVGTQKKNHKIKPEEQRKTAFHEAGHAVLSHVLPTQDPVKQISIIPSGMALGYTINPPEEDKYNVYRTELSERISMMLGGRAAEEIFLNDISGGASDDIKRATGIAKQMVTVYGMSDKLGAIRYGSQHSSDEVFLGRDFASAQDYSEATAALIDEEVKRIMDEAYTRAKELLNEYKDKVEFIVEYLLKHETIDGEEFRLIMDEDATMERLDEIAAEKKRKSDEANRYREAEMKAEAEREERELRRREEEYKKERENPRDQSPHFPWDEK